MTEIELWLDEAILEVLRFNRGVVGIDALMEVLWRMEKEEVTACSGWIAEEEDGRIVHWCKQAWEILEIMKTKGIVRFNGEKIVLVKR